jgi:arsenate reductase
MFVCIHNSGRSQIGEALLRHLAGDRFEVHSAGLEAGKLNPLVVQVMAEQGIDMSSHFAKTVQEYIDRKEHFDYVITVCDETNAERCPLFPGKHQRIHWSFPDPSALTGSDAEKVAAIQPIRVAIETKIREWLANLA